MDDLGESYGKWLRVQILGLDCLHSCPVSATSLCDTHLLSASYESGPIYGAGNPMRKSAVSRAFYFQRAEMDNKPGWVVVPSPRVETIPAWNSQGCTKD